MTTVMTWETSGGKKGRCDARCHNAVHPKCVCACGGKFHGVAHKPGGIEQAGRDTWEKVIREAEQKAAAEGTVIDTSRLRKFLGLDNHANHNDCPQPDRHRKRSAAAGTEKEGKEELENRYKGWQLKLRLDQNKDKEEGGRK